MNESFAKRQILTAAHILRIFIYRESASDHFQTKRFVAMTYVKKSSSTSKCCYKQTSCILVVVFCFSTSFKDTAIASMPLYSARTKKGLCS